VKSRYAQTSGNSKWLDCFSLDILKGRPVGAPDLKSSGEKPLGADIRQNIKRLIDIDKDAQRMN